MFDMCAFFYLAQAFAEGSRKLAADKKEKKGTENVVLFSSDLDTPQPRAPCTDSLLQCGGFKL